jgi:YfiH family protein
MADNRFLISPTQNFLYHQQLASFKWMLHGFSLRFDPEPKRDLNLGLNDYQPAEIVLENRKRLARAVSGREIPLITLRQTHSDRIVTIRSKKPLATAPEADAMITVQNGILLAIQTADCLPVLVVDPVRKVIAAIHAGWRGLLKRITLKAIEQMQKDFSTVPADCLAVIGPGIGPCCYEVGEEMIQAFSKEFAGKDSFFRSFNRKDLTARSTKSLDLVAACKYQLLESGVPQANIFSSESCTSCRTDLFFSHRAEKRKTGRMMGVIGIEESHDKVS